MPSWWDQASQPIRRALDDARGLTASFAARPAARPPVRRPPIPPTPSIQSWLAGFAEKDRPGHVKSYLATVDKRHREAERGYLLRAARWASTVPETDPRRVERRVAVDLEVPLFDLCAPSVAGAQVSVHTYAKRTVVSSWQVTMGVGGGPTQISTVIQEATFTVGPDEHKRVYLPVSATAIRRYHVSEIAVGGRYPLVPMTASAFDAVVTPTLGNRPLARSLEEHEVAKEQTRSVWAIPLGRDRSAHPTVYTETYDTTRRYDLRAGGTALGLSVTTEASVTHSHGFALSLTLPGGYDYYLKAIDSHPGIRWATFRK